MSDLDTKGWKTLSVCEKYDLDPTLTKCCLTLAHAGRDEIRKHPENYQSELITVLNYLDGIAIGIEQNLYVESLVRDHLERILKTHVEKTLVGSNAADLKIDASGYDRLIRLYNRWSGTDDVQGTLRPPAPSRARLRP
jgi:hypothetical protein